MKVTEAIAEPVGAIISGSRYPGMSRPRIKQDDDAPPRQRERPIKELNEDMSRGDIAHVLQHMSFVGGTALLSIDHGVRDFLLAGGAAALTLS